MKSWASTENGAASAQAPHKRKAHNTPVGPDAKGCDYSIRTEETYEDLHL